MRQLEQKCDQTAIAAVETTIKCTEEVSTSPGKLENWHQKRIRVRSINKQPVFHYENYVAKSKMRCTSHEIGNDRIL